MLSVSRLTVVVDFRSRKVRLWEFNEENDLAIFRVSSSAERTSGPPGIGRNTLSSDQSDNQEADIPIFTIAYSNDDEPFVEDSEFSKERRSQNPEFHAKIASLMNHLGPQATVHQYMQQAYRQKLNETDKGRTIDATIDFTDAKSRNINQLVKLLIVSFNNIASILITSPGQWVQSHLCTQRKIACYGKVDPLERRYFGYHGRNASRRRKVAHA